MSPLQCQHMLHLHSFCFVLFALSYEQFPHQSCHAADLLGQLLLCHSQASRHNVSVGFGWPEGGWLCRPIEKRERSLQHSGPTWRAPMLHDILLNLPFLRHAPKHLIEVSSLTCCISGLSNWVLNRIVVSRCYQQEQRVCHLWTKPKDSQTHCCVIRCHGTSSHEQNTTLAISLFVSQPLQSCYVRSKSRRFPLAVTQDCNQRTSKSAQPDMRKFHEQYLAEL